MLCPNMYVFMYSILRVGVNKKKCPLSSDPPPPPLFINVSLEPLLIIFKINSEKVDFFSGRGVEPPTPDKGKCPLKS